MWDYFTCLPRELLCRIFLECSLQGVLQLRQCSRILNAVSHEHVIWLSCLTAVCQDMRIPLFLAAYKLDNSADLQHKAISHLRFRTSTRISPRLRVPFREGLVVRPDRSRKSQPSLSGADQGFQNSKLLPGGRFLVSITKNFVVCLWDLQLREPLKELPAYPIQTTQLDVPEDVSLGMIFVEDPRPHEHGITFLVNLYGIPLGTGLCHTTVFNLALDEQSHPGIQMSILGTHSTQGPVTPQQYAAHVNGRLVTWRDYLDISFHDLKSGLSVQWSIDPVLIKCLQAMPDGYVIAFMDEDCSFHIYAPPDDALFRPGEPIHVVSNPPIAKFCLDAEMTLYGPNRFTVRPSDIYVYSGPDPRYKCFCDVCFISPGGGVIVLHKILGRRDNGTGEWFQETLSVSRDLPLVSEDVLHSQMLPGGDRLLYWSDDKTHSILQFYMARIAEPSKSYGGILYHCNPQSTCRPGDLVWWAVSVCAFTGRVCVANREKGVLEVLDFVTAAPEADRAIAKQCQHSGQLRKGSIFHRVTHKLVKGFHRKVGATS